MQAQNSFYGNFENSNVYNHCCQHLSVPNQQQFQQPSFQKSSSINGQYNFMPQQPGFQHRHSMNCNHHTMPLPKGAEIKDFVPCQQKPLPQININLGNNNRRASFLK